MSKKKSRSVVLSKGEVQELLAEGEKVRADIERRMRGPTPAERRASHSVLIASALAVVQRGGSPKAAADAILAAIDDDSWRTR